MRCIIQQLTLGTYDGLDSSFRDEREADDSSAGNSIRKDITEGMLVLTIGGGSIASIS